MHYDPLNLPPSYPIAAIYQNTAPDPTSPWAMPGKYEAKLTVNGYAMAKASFEIKMDPRVKTSVVDLQKQHDLSYDCYTGRKEIMRTLNEISRLRSQLKGLQPKATGELLKSITEMDVAISRFQSTQPGSTDPSFARIDNAFAGLFNILQEADQAPTSQTVNAANETKTNYKKLLADWNRFKTKQVPELNKRLKDAGIVQLSF
jgi:hypothetical protein